MINFDSRICLGFSPTMLFPKSFEDPLMHFAAIQICCHYPNYDAFETYLPDDKKLRERCIREMKAAEKRMHYNSPGILQTEGQYNPCSNDKRIRQRALEYAKMHINFAAESESPFFIVTGAPDKGDAYRTELLKYYKEFFLQLSEYCKQYRMDILIEPIERHRFKKLILGPTKECALFIMEMQRCGADNAHMMLDIAHLPLMEEDMEQAVKNSIPAGLEHIHMGDAVLDPTNAYYGHTHPPVGIQKGIFDIEDIEEQIRILFKYEYISKNTKTKRANISLEVRPYPGCSEETSIHLMYEKIKSAFDNVVKNL